MMLTFMNSKLIIYIYIYIGEDQEFIHVFYWWIPLDLEIYTKCKKSSNLMKDRSIHIYIYICLKGAYVDKMFLILYVYGDKPPR